MNKIYFVPSGQKLSRIIVKFGLLAFILGYYTALSAQSSDSTIQRNASVFVENLDKFPSNDQFVFSRIQIPFSRDSATGTNYNANHDSLTVRIHNNGMSNITIKNLVLSNDTTWQFVKLKGVDYIPDSLLPFTINSGSYADLTVKFVAVDAETRVKILHDTLSIVSNDDSFPVKSVYFTGLWQYRGESTNEPHLPEIFNALGFTTNIGFSYTDPDKGDSTKLKGDQIKSSYFVRADTTRPVTVRQISAYHACCTSPQNIQWYAKESSTFNTIFTHLGIDAQSLLPRKGLPNTPASGTISPSTPFGFKVGSKDYTDPSKDPNGKIGIRIFKAYDVRRNIIPNSFILSVDYIGNQFTNYDYQDNTYFVTNIKPELGAAYFSALNPSPSDIDFGEKILQTNSSFQLKLSSLGKIYPDSSADPVIKIDSVAIKGENKSEFTAAMPVKNTLNPQDSTILTVNFTPATQGLKIADLLIYYNNSLSPLRVPLYGIGRSSDTMVVVNYRINSGSSTPLTINGKTWAADNQYSFDNLQPFTNTHLHQIAGTDEDSLYLKEQSSNATKKPFRYEFPVENGDYAVRLHFAEIYWGAPGSGINGGAGSRAMNVSLENQLRLINFDVTHEVGGATALVKNLPVTVADGKLNIDFSSNIDRPMVVAVEVLSFHASTILSSAPPVYNDTSRFQNTDANARVYPNPFQKAFKIKFSDKYARRNPTLQIADATGNVYQIGKVEIPAGGSTINVDISNLPLRPGVYYLRILPETGETGVIKLVIP